MGVTIGDKHSLKDWNLILTNVVIETPQPKLKTVMVPGVDGVLDLTESLTGYVPYENRTISLELQFLDNDTSLWHRKYSDFANAYHGKKTKMIFDNDAKYFYEGRILVLSDKSTSSHASFLVTMDADPYKYDIYSSTENWLWDPFAFERDIAREYKNIVVDGRYQLQVIGSHLPLHPVIVASKSLRVIIDSIEYHLSPGENHLYDVLIMNQTYDFLFIGNAEVTVEIRGGSM
jgi:hypothetical protein